MKLELSEFEYGDGEYRMLCPHCKNDYLHCYQVDTYERAEDDNFGVHTEIAGKTTTINTDMSGNPSRRRDGFRAKFWCESCEYDTLLSFSQHKGLTLVGVSIFEGERS